MVFRATWICQIYNHQRIRIYISKEFGLLLIEAWIEGMARVSGLRKGYRVVDGIEGVRRYNGSKRRNRKLSLMSFLTLKALKAGYTRLTHPGGAREPFNSKLPGNYTSVTVLSRAKAQTWGLIAAISYFNLGSRKCICHSLVAQRLLVSETAITRRNYSATLNSATATSRVDWNLLNQK